MSVVALAYVLAMTVSSANPGSAGGAALEPVPKSIATRQTIFAIPFQISPHEEAGRQAVEVQLYVSANRGARWDLYSRVEPARGQFLFRAGGDGEYWFLIRTLDRSGRLHPQYNNAPGLVVIVDTRPPILNLKAQRGDAGQITARWEAVDPHVNLDSLQIQYRTPLSPAWQAVAIDRKSITANGPAQTGELTWWPKVDTGRVEIRAEVADMSGNSTVTHAQVDLGGGPVASSDPQTVWGQPGGAAGPQLSGATWRSSSSPPAPGSSVAVQPNPPIRNQFVAQPAPGPGSGPQVLEVKGAPGGVRPRMVNTRLFELEYNVEGPPGAGRAELWGTTDNGRTWSRFGTDDDGRSPMLVTVSQEGTYGFRIALEARPGQGTSPPQPGEPPDVWICVDLTKPTAQILAAEQGTGDKAGQVIIRWQAEDRMLAARPVSLSFAETPGGPWTVIAAGLENTGQYGWAIDGRVPARFYLRLEVRDEAGNVGVAETPKAVELKQLQPSARIRDVRPLGDSARLPPKRYYFAR